MVYLAQWCLAVLMYNLSIIGHFGEDLDDDLGEVV